MVLTHILSANGQLNVELKTLPVLQPHPLPSTLRQWQDTQNEGDYFSQVKPTEVGSLVWSQFPVRVYPQLLNSGTESKQTQSWLHDVRQAVQEWSVYLPLVMVEQPERADITIVPLPPPLRLSPTGTLLRVRSAETRYELSMTTHVLAHHCTIWVSPSQTGQYLRSAVRHELGHALGIWGHSPVPTDVMYFSQVRNPPAISPRDINTLKRVYEQPTRLGWRVGGGEGERGRGGE